MVVIDRSLLARATSSDDSPTPGYMYGEIAKMSLISYDHCKELEEYLVGKVKKSNHNTKFKALVIIKHVCRHGRPEFKRDMARLTEPIREALQFNGPPDPLRGDQIYKRVHEAAKEALDAIYDSELPQQAGTSTVSTRIQGFGSEPYPTQQPPAPAPGTIGALTDMAASVVGQVSSRLGVSGSGTGPNASLTGSGYRGPGDYGGKHVPNGATYNGSYAAPGGVAGGGFGGPSMRGLGNPNFQDPRLEKSFLQKAGELVRSQIGEVVTTVTAAKGQGAPLSRVTFAPPPDYNYATNRGPTANQWSTPSAPPPAPVPAPPSAPAATRSLDGVTSSYQQAKNQQAFQWVQSDGSSSRRLGGVGGVWGQTSSMSRQSSQEPNHTGQALGDGNAAAATGPPQQLLPPQPGRVGGAASDGSYERHLVKELCAPGGTRAVPPKEKLDEFLVAVRTLNVDLVGGVVLDELGDQSWQVRSKVLHVIESLIRSSGMQDYRNFFVDNGGELEAVLSDSKAVVRDRAVKILRSLGINPSEAQLSSPAVSTSSAPPQSPALEHQGSLLEFDEPDAPPPPPSSTSSSTSHPPPPAAPANTHATDLFSGTNVMRTPTRPSSSSVDANANGLLAGMTLKASPAPSPQHHKSNQSQDVASPAALLGTLALDDGVYSQIAQRQEQQQQQQPPLPQQQHGSEAATTADPTARQQQQQDAQQHAANSRRSTANGGDLLLIDEPALERSSGPLDAFDPLAHSGGKPSRSYSSSAASDLAALQGCSSGGGSGGLVAGMTYRGGAPPVMGMGVGGGVYGQPPQLGMQAMAGSQLLPGGVPSGFSPMMLNQMGRGMIPALQPRTIIPSATEESSSGFSFIGGGAPHAATVAQPEQPTEDAFSFVKDAMRRS